MSIVGITKHDDQITCIPFLYIILDEDGHSVLADLGLAENIVTFEGGEDMMVQFPVWLESESVDARTKLEA